MREASEKLYQDHPVEPVSGRYPSSHPASNEVITAPAGPRQAAQQAKSLPEMAAEITRYQEDGERHRERIAQIDHLLADLKEVRDFLEDFNLLPLVVQTPFTHYQDIVRKNPPAKEVHQHLSGTQMIEQSMEDSYQKEVARNYRWITKMKSSPVIFWLGVDLPADEAISAEAIDKPFVETQARDLYRSILFRADRLVEALQNFTHQTSSLAEMGMYGSFLKICDRMLEDSARRAPDARSYEEALENKRHIYTPLSGVGINPLNEQIEKNAQLDAWEKSRASLLKGANYFFVGAKEYVSTLMEVLVCQKERLKKEPA